MPSALRGTPASQPPLSKALCGLTVVNLDGKIVFLTGIMAAGKSTVGQILSERLNRSVHLRGDLFRKLIVKGRADMSGNPSEEAMRQLELRYELGASTALRYAEEGFAVVYQDIVLGDHLAQLASRLRAEDYLFVLCPDVGTVAKREMARSKTGYRGLTPNQLDEVLRFQTKRIGYWLDNSDLSAAETVEVMLSNLEKARIGPAT